MAEDERENVRIGSSDAVFALGAVNDPAMREEVREYVKRQSELAALQIEDMKREDAVRHRSLRIRHTSELLKLTFELAAAGVVLAILLFLGSAVWSATHDNGLVIEAFDVPSDFTARGVSGKVLAAQLLDSLGKMQDETDSARPASSYQNNWGGDFKVQIPDTGVSIGEFVRYLHSTLGHQTEINGELYRTDGGIAITARIGSDPVRVEGAAGDLDKLVQQTAEAIYLRTQPYRYAVHLPLTRNPEAIALLMRLIHDPSPVERTWANIGLESISEGNGNMRTAAAYGEAAAALSPGFALASINLANDYAGVGHDEESLAMVRRAITFLKAPGGGQINARAGRITQLTFQQTLATDVGDFSDVPAFGDVAETLPDYSGSVQAARDNTFIALGLGHDAAGFRRKLQSIPPIVPPAVVFNFQGNYVEAKKNRTYALALGEEGLEDWPAVLRDMTEADRLATSEGAAVRYYRLSYAWPGVARAEAHLGRIAEARSLIAKTPRDCYICVLSRAQIEAAAKNWSAASEWFARAVHLAPSLPAGYHAWGRMLLAKGDLKGAIAQFGHAIGKGQHYADPLEGWGEALMLENRSDLALAKFEEAGRYTPKWSRLHLKWGEALLYAGRKDEARKQLTAASVLGLSASDKSELVKVSRGHG